VAFASTSIYSATAAALNSLGETLAVELAPRSVRVNVLSAGPIDTPIIKKVGLPADQHSAQVDVNDPLRQFEAVALIEEGRGLEPGLVREEPENGEADKSFPLEEARRLARAILRLDGLTGVGGPRGHSPAPGNCRQSLAVNSRVLQSEYILASRAGQQNQRGREVGWDGRIIQNLYAGAFA
jgi:enoyl-ACP reductase-like protein